METNFKGTTGEMIQSGKNAVHKENVGCVALTFQTYNEEDRRKYDAQLITDAFNVRQQINVDLPELLEQRNEMVEVLKSIVKFSNDTIIIDDEVEDFFQRIQSKCIHLIIKIEQK